MSSSAHTRRRLGSSIACALAAALIAVPLASASGSREIITEHSATQNRVDLLNAYGPLDPWMYPLLNKTEASPAGRSTNRLITENSADQNRVDLQNAYSQLDPWLYHMLHEANAYTASSEPPERLITENSASQNRFADSSTPPVGNVAVSSPHHSSWIDIGIGAAGTLALTLLAAGAIFAVRRTRGRLAPAR
jgi:hypothetical protein